jgi:5,10-methylenetetrahydromethanopterin reductase
VTLQMAGRPLGFGFIRDLPTREMVDLALRAEELGFDSLWTVEHNFGRDGVTPFAAIAYATRRATLAMAVIPIFTRTPLLLASTFGTLDELAGGRMIIGLGAGSRLLIQAQGIAFEKPLTALRENVEVIRTLLREQKATFHGKVVHHEHVELDFEPVRKEVPIWIGATGPRALELSGEIADGVVLNAFTSNAYTQRAVELIRRGQTRRESSLEFGISNMMVCVIDEDRQRALRKMRPVLALYLARLPDVSKQSGFDPEVVERLTEAVNQEGAEAGARFLTDEMVDTLVICGPISRLRERVEQDVAAGVTHPVVFPLDNWAGTLDLFAKGLS